MMSIESQTSSGSLKVELAFVSLNKLSNLITLTSLTGMGAGHTWDELEVVRRCRCH